MDNIIKQILTTEEEASIRLRSIYEQYGYSQFKMSKFEEYDLYATNKDFLQSKGIISFTDTNGKLMALKPDVTLSIVRRMQDKLTSLKKLYYNENVYRVDKDTQSYKEFLQVGLECLGQIDIYNTLEVIALACKSLESISPNYILTLSHMGILNRLLAALQLPTSAAAPILKFIGEKNIHGIKDLCQQYQINQTDSANLVTCLTYYGDAKIVVQSLKDSCFYSSISEYVEELEVISSNLNKMGYKSIQIDFSTTNDMNYYNGILFQGFISNIPSAIVSGGRYDNLLNKMGKNYGGIGFAFYINLLSYLPSFDKSYDIDVLLTYDSNCNIQDVINNAHKLISSGKRIQVQNYIPKDIKYKQIVKLGKGG